MKKATSVLAALLLSMAIPSYADDLLSLYAQAFQNDPRFRAALSNLHAIEQHVPQARAGLLPRAQASATRNRNDERTTTDSTIVSRPTGQAEYSNSEYTFSVTQPIYNAESNAALRQAGAEVRKAEADYTAAQQDLIMRLSQAYFECLLAQESWSLAVSEKEALAKHLDAAQARHRAGVAAITEVEEARARWQIASAQEIDANSQFEDKRQALREIVGQPPAQLAKLADDIPSLASSAEHADRLVETALQHNADVRAAKDAVDVAHEDIAKQRAGHYPTLDLVGSKSRTDADGSISGPGVRGDQTVLGFKLNVPLVQGGLVSARTQESVHRHDAALQDLEAKRRAAERVTRNTLRGMSAARAKAEALRQAISSNETTLDAKTQGYRAGMYHLLDVLDATRELFKTRKDYSEARYTFLISHLRLQQALGSLSEDDLQAVNKWLR